MTTTIMKQPRILLLLLLLLALTSSVVLGFTLVTTTPRPCHLQGRLKGSLHMHAPPADGGSGSSTLSSPISSTSSSSSSSTTTTTSSSSSSSSSKPKGFGDNLKRSSSSGSSRGKSVRPRAPNSFSSMGKAVKHRSKFGGVGMPVELGLLDMSSKLTQQYEQVKERYAGHRPVQPGGGRQRGAKRASAFHALSSYSLHFVKLLEEELLYEEAEVMQRLRHWTRGRLQEEGLAVFGVVARPRGRLFKEYILRFTLPAKKGGSGGSTGAGKKAPAGAKNKENGAAGGGGGGRGGGGNSGPPGIARAPPMHYHRLGPGDIISITPDRQSPLGSDAVIEGLVLERGPFFIDVVVKEIPPGVTWRRGDPTGGERFRLDLYLNRISFQRMVAAVHQITGFETGYTVSPEIREILVKSFAERFDVLFNGGGNGGMGGGVNNNPHSLLAMSPYAAATAAHKQKKQSSLNRRIREDEDNHKQHQTKRRQRATKEKHPRGSSSSSSSPYSTTTPLPPSSWETLARAVPKTSFTKKDAEKLVTEGVDRFSLNDSQEQALRMALTRKLSLIQGPPGTGKTRTACHLINIAVKLSQRRDSGKVLGVAFSNVAADNLLEGCLRLGLNAVRVGRAATVRPELRNYTLDALMTQHASVSTFKKKLEAVRGSSAREVQAAKRDLEDAELMAAVSILGNADVVVSTCVGAANEVILNAASVTVSSSSPSSSSYSDSSSGITTNKRGPPSPFRVVKFPTVIIDEASQATEPATLIPLTQGCEQLVLVGDHYQLPPTIKSKAAAQQGLGVSLFTRLAMAGIQPSLLTVQYRMHPLIAQFPSRRFYGGLLQTHPANKHRPRPEGFPWPNPALPVAFVAVGGGDGEFLDMQAPYFEQRTSGNQTSYLNRKEGEAVMEVLGGVLRRGQLQCKDIGIVTPYSAQVKHVTELAQTRIKPFSHADLEIQSVDAYQGREKELILISAVRSNYQGKVGFLGDWRRLNVAITRAKRGLVVFGDPRTLKNDPHWGAYMKWCLKNECVLTLKQLRQRMK